MRKGNKNILFHYINNMGYRSNTPVKYTNATEYRQCLRDLFEMNQEKYEQQIRELENHNDETLDPETHDEMSYDDDAANRSIDYVFECTKDVAEFRNLYLKAAAKMLSEDPTIGIAIMFSYDYLYYFHACLVEFFEGRFSVEFDLYKDLLKILS